MSESFSNAPVAVDDLPHVQDVAFTSVSPRYPVYVLVGHLIFWAIAVPGALVGTLVGFEIIIVRVAPVLMLVPAVGIAAASYLEAKRRAWALRDHDLLYRSGLVFHKSVVLPLTRVQHVESTSGPIERAFDLMRVTCYTAGGQQADLVIKGLRTAEAERVRQYLLQQIQQHDEQADD